MMKPLREREDPFWPLWLRHHGFRVIFFLVFFIGWFVINTIFVAESPRQPRPPFRGSNKETLREDIYAIYSWFVESAAHELGRDQLSSVNFQRFGYIGVLTIFSIRLLSLAFFPLTFMQYWYMLHTRHPEGGFEEENLTRPSSKKKTARKFRRRGVYFPTGFLPRRVFLEEINHSRHVHCICIRILTRGDAAAQPLVKTAVTTAVKIFKLMCTYDHLKVHIVTQTKFSDDAFLKQLRLLGATESKELFVPSDYVTRNGSLFKARNICYWQDQGGVGKECDLARSWILSLDEEAVITKPLVRSFINDVLRNPDEPKIGYALGPALMDFYSGPVSFMVKVLESRWVACHYTFLKRKMNTIENTFCFHGGAYFARASCDLEVGNDWGPAASVSDDYAIGLAINELEIGVKHLDGWFIEGTKPNLWAYITHNARNIRGQIYATLSLDLSYDQFVLQCGRLILGFLIPLFQACYTVAFFIRPVGLLPGAPGCALLDMIIIFTIATQATAITFGASYMHLERWNTIGCILMGIVMMLFGDGLIFTTSNLLCFYYMYKDRQNRSFSYEMTSKCIQT